MSNIYDINTKFLNDLSLVILSFNRREELLNNLPALCQGSVETGFELIVVDNSSTDGSREVLADLEKQYQNLRVIYNDKNLGVAGGRNTGWRMATRKFILNIDDDTHISITEIISFYKLALEKPDIGIISPRILHAITGIAQNDHGDKEYEPANFHGACHLVRRDVYQIVGEIDPYCYFGGEELDYSIRVRAAGFKVIYTPKISIKHNNFIRLGGEAAWRRRQWVYNFSRVYFKHFPVYIALMFSFRYLISHLASSMRQNGLIFALSLPNQVVLGALDGKRQYQSIPREVREFYTSPTLRPDFGNIPLYRKFLKKIK